MASPVVRVMTRVSGSMDISIACSDRSPTPELQAGQTSATRPILAEPATVRATGLAGERGSGAAVRPLLVCIKVRFVASAHPPGVIDMQTAHRDSSYCR